MGKVFGVEILKSFFGHGGAPFESVCFTADSLPYILNFYRQVAKNAKFLTAFLATWRFDLAVLYGSEPQINADGL
jgi:hypothetical protein